MVHAPVVVLVGVVPRAEPEAGVVVLLARALDPVDVLAGLLDLRIHGPDVPPEYRVVAGGLVTLLRAPRPPLGVEDVAADEVDRPAYAPLAKEHRDGRSH